MQSQLGLLESAFSFVICNEIEQAANTFAIDRGVNESRFLVVSAASIKRPLQEYFSQREEQIGLAVLPKVLGQDPERISHDTACE